MATAERDRDAAHDQIAREEGSKRSADDLAASRDGKADRSFFEHFRKHGEDAEKTEMYIVADPKKNPFRFIWEMLVHNRGWKQSCQISEPAQEIVESNETWQARVSILLLQVLWFINKPFKAVGGWIEDTFNIVLANGGLFRTVFRAIFNRSKLARRERDSKEYVSLLGALDPRFDFYLDKSSSGGKSSSGNGHTDDANSIYFPAENHGARSTADVLIMAAKVAYENPAFVEEVVTKTWKMNFVTFYNCWNEFQQQTNTQVFVFTDRPKDARAIVVAFRGTELFNAIDWSTDFDFSWFEMKDLGQVHVGFLEALGLGDRKRMASFATMRDKADSNRTTSTPNTPISGLPDAVVEEPNKILAYDDITKLVNKLMKENPEAKLFVTGHSLGGALANMYTTFLFYNKENTITSRLAALYTFGQPRVGGEEYGQFMISNVKDSRYWRVVYGNDLVCRVPFDDSIFHFKHPGYCYYYDALYKQMYLVDAPNANYFSLSLVTVIMVRVVALYELIVSIFSGWIYGPEFRETYAATAVRVLGLISPGLIAHLTNNYVTAIRLGPTALEAKLQQLDNRTHGLVSFFSSLNFRGRFRKVDVPAAVAKNAHED